MAELEIIIKFNKIRTLVEKVDILINEMNGMNEWLDGWIGN